MKKALLIVFLVATAAWAQHPLTFEDLAAIHRIGAPQVSPDGKWIAYDASTPDLKANKGVSAVMMVPSAGGGSRKIADGSSPAWSPDGKTLAYIKDDQVQLYVDGTSRKLTDLAGGVGSLKWMPDSKGLLVVSDIYPDCGVDPACIKDKTTAAESKPTSARIITSLLYRHWKAWQAPTRTHILFVPLSGNARDLTPGAFDAPPFSIGGGDEFDVSPDGKELAFARDTSDHPELSTNSDVFIVPIAGGDARRITTRLGADTSPKYSPDGHYIAYRSQSRAGYESDLWELWLYDRASGTSRRIAPTFQQWVNAFIWAPDSQSLYVTYPVATKNGVTQFTLSDNKPHTQWAQASADGLAISGDGKTLYFERSSLTSPAEIYSLGTNGKDHDQITHENDALLRSIVPGEVSDYRYTGADGAQIQALIVKPPNFDASKKYPAIVLIHGGPQGAWSDAWSYRWNSQMWAARGYVVFMPNPRGSTGYGQKFVEEISGDWGGKAYIDIMNGVDKLAAMPFVDSNRIGAAGASFGGYMIDWILGHTNRFKALASHDGVYNLTSMYGVTEELWFPEWEFHGNPWDNPELYEKWSPHLYVKNFKTPTLVIHSELDYRVPIDQGLQLFTALQRRGVPSKLLYFPDEGHWVLKPRNSRLWYETVIGWFDQYLK
ncbi:MAG TPA: S9 family peptidase [Thermoanaerobaculia bacterium]